MPNFFRQVATRSIDVPEQQLDDERGSPRRDIIYDSLTDLRRQRPSVYVEGKCTDQGLNVGHGPRFGCTGSYELVEIPRAPVDEGTGENNSPNMHAPKTPLAAICMSAALTSHSAAQPNIRPKKAPAIVAHPHQLLIKVMTSLV
jgi:hypothetical protein